MEILITGIIAFISTNIDDIFILMMFFGNRKYRDSSIIIGQLLGIISLVVISMICSLAGLFISPAYIGLLGLFPIYLGVQAVWELSKNMEERDEVEKSVSKNKNHALAVAGVTIANGGDNIGIYIPLFASLTAANKTIMVTIFLLMTLVWCLIAKYLTARPYTAKTINKYGHLVTPFVLIFLGCYILYESGTLTLFF